MTDGFGAVFDELHQTAGKIGDVVSGTADLPWNGPSGDYGHPGVQAGWARFVEDARAEITKLFDKANEHGDGLRAAAGLYQESDAESGEVFGKAGSLLDSLPPAGGMVGGGYTGGIKDVVDRALGNPTGPADGGIGEPSGFMNPERAARLDPDSGIASTLNPDIFDAGEEVSRQARERREGPLY